MRKGKKRGFLLFTFAFFNFITYGYRLHIVFIIEYLLQQFIQLIQGFAFQIGTGNRFCRLFFAGGGGREYRLPAGP